MKSSSACPDITLLSRFLDQELSVPEDQTVTEHMETCTACRTLTARLQHAAGKGHALLNESSTSSPSALLTPACLSPETIAAYVQRLLSDQENLSAEQHVQSCHACLNEVQTAFRITTLLSAPVSKPVPSALKTCAAVSWQSARASLPRTTLSRVVIQLAEQGLRLLEQNLVAPFFNLQEILVPAPAYRSEEAPTRLDLKLIAGQHVVALTVIPDGKGVALTLTLLGPQPESLAGQRVSFNQQGKLILSKKTDRQGLLRVPHLDLGVYEIVCASMEASFEVELHA